MGVWGRINIRSLNPASGETVFSFELVTLRSNATTYCCVSIAHSLPLIFNTFFLID